MRHPAPRVMAAVAAGACLVLLPLAQLASPWSSPTPRDEETRQAAESEAPTSTTSRSSVRSPRRVCGTDRLLGPRERPPGARRVRTSDDLAALVDRAPAGSTFWLEPGVHRLGTGEYDQVTPKPDMTFVGAPGAVLDGQRRNRYAFTGKATGVTIQHLTISAFGPRGSNNNEGVVNHDAGHGWRILHNTVSGNAGAGVFVGTDNVVSHNCLKGNGQYGFSAYEPDGVENVTLRHNEIVGNNTDDWESRIESCGCSGGGKFWDTSNARILDNWIHDNASVGLWADTNNTGFLVRGNHISDNDSEGFIYETSYNARIVSNTFARNAHVAGPENTGFPAPALYLSESGSDPRAGARYGRTFVVAHNRFIDNWAGVMAWENADRFAGSPANTSSGYTTLVNPGVATLEACSDPDRIGTAPYIDDCRWKTQHLRVQHNTFRFTPSHVGSACTRSAGCGFVGLVSQWGSYPDWSPYKGQVVERAITFRQDNRWEKNRYVGPWRYQILELGNAVSWRTWRDSPYRQDRGSKRRS
jgi:Right handed beta helix region